MKVYIKKSLCALAVAVTAFTSASLVSGCSEKAKLAKQIDGTWTGNPERITEAQTASASMVRTLTFIPSAADATEGVFRMEALITVGDAMRFNDSIVSPIEVNATGTASISGVYEIKDDDDIILSLDANSFTVEVDPEAVELNYNLLTGNSSPNVETLKPGALALVRHQIARTADMAFAGVNKIDDIHITKNLMRAEINHTDNTYTRQE